MILHYNTIKNTPVTASGAISTAVPVFGFRDVIDITLHLVDAANAPRDLSHIKAWTAALDNDFRDDTPVMAESAFDQFDASVAASGVIGFTVDCGSDVWAAKTAGKSGVPAWLELRGFDAAGNQVERYRIRVTAQTIVNAGEGFPAPNDIASRSWVIALWRAGMAVQFSMDGETPLDVEPDEGAKFYRIRPASYGGDWSVWMQVPRGETGTAATFAIVETVTLQPGSPAEVVEAEESTSGARKYIVRVPQGVKGDRGLTGPAVAYNPVLAAGTVADANYGRVAYLGSDIDLMTAFDPQYDVSRVVLRLVSANAAITGNVVLVPVVNGVDGAAVVVPVGATVAPVELALVCNGKLSIRRDWQDARDTLRDGVPVTAIVVAWEVHHG